MLDCFIMAMNRDTRLCFSRKRKRGGALILACLPSTTEGILFKSEEMITLVQIDFVECTVPVLAYTHSTPSDLSLRDLVSSLAR